MLGICINEKEFTGNPENTFVKPIVLFPGEELRSYKTEKGNRYLIFNNYVLSRPPDPVYNVGEVYYVKETWCYTENVGYAKDGYHIKGDKTMPDACATWKNKAQMPQAAARTFIKITGCDFVCVPDQPLGYEYKFEIIEK